MDTLKIKTLEQVSDASEIVEEARADKNLNREDKLALEKIAVKLRNLERSIIKIMQKELLDTLKADTKELKELTVRIKESSKKLARVAGAVEKASEVVESFIKIVTTAAASGLI